MNFEFMRKIDRFAGIPLCGILTIIRKIRSFIFPYKNDINNAKKILLIKPSELGSIILSFRLVKRIREQFPNSEIYFLTFHDNKAILKMLNYTAENCIFSIRPDNFWTLIKDTYKAIRTIKSLKIDISIDLEFFSRYTAILSFLIGAKKRIGFDSRSEKGLYRGDLFTDYVRYNSKLHISKVFESIIMNFNCSNDLANKQINLEKDFPITNYVPSNNQIEDMYNRLKKSGINTKSTIYLINPGEGAIPLREWPLENFINLTNHLLKDKNIFVIIIGLKQNYTRIRKLEKVVNSTRIVNLCGKTSISELLTLFTISEGLIINDSGLAHLASLTNIRQYILFGPENPQIWSPIGENINIFYSNLGCSPCLSVFNHRTSKCKSNKCLQLIDMNDVYNTIVHNICGSNSTLEIINIK